MTETAAIPASEAPIQPTVFMLIEAIYKIYKSADEFVPVKAHSALEAIKISGIDNIFRVERDSLDRNYLLDLNKASELILSKTAPAAGVPDAAPPAPAETQQPAAQ